MDTTIVPSTSASLLITEIVITTSSLTIAESLLATGGVVAKTVMKIVSLTHFAGNGKPLSQILTTTKSVPIYPILGV